MNVQKQYIVFTDLDGSLLDHFTYSWLEAQQAVQALFELKIPLILVTSKTLAETQSIAQELPGRYPMIVENGGSLVIPENYFDDLGDGESRHENGYIIVNLGVDYHQITDTLKKIRLEHDFKFTGFADMSVSDVIKHTGLGETEAALAKQRHSSEPFLWQDSDDRIRQLATILQSSQLGLTRGGRFWHAGGKTSKSIAINALLTYYLDNGYEQVCSLSLGDSENDTSMLQETDYGVIIQKHDGRYLQVEAKKNTLIKSKHPGPRGWNQAVLDWLDTMGLTHE